MLKKCFQCIKFFQVQSFLNVWYFISLLMSVIISLFVYVCVIWHKSLFSLAVFLALFGQAEASKAEVFVSYITIRLLSLSVLCNENISGSIFQEH